MWLQVARDFTTTLTRHRRLIIELARREIFERTAGQALGVTWSLLLPLVQIAVYLFIFVAVLRARLSVAAPTGMDYASYILIGLVPWIALQDLVARAAVLGPGHRSVLKQTVFPAEVLPLKTVCAALFPFAVSMLALLAFIAVKYGGLPSSAWLLLPAIIMLISWMIAIAYLLGAIGVFLRDIKDIATLVMFIGTYLAPIVYEPAAVPQAFRLIVECNPFSWILWCFQDAIFFGGIEHPLAWILSATVAIIAPLGAYALFMRARPYFSEFL